MASEKYWIWLTLGQEPPYTLALRAAEHFGSPENAYFADEGSVRASSKFDESECRRLSDKNLDRAELILERCERGGMSILTIQDAGYPERLRNIPDPPALLYTLGTLPFMDEELALGVVGTRSATAYGVSVTERLCSQLASSGVVIVSGMAEGVDAAAHHGALRAGGRSVAVLGGGADVIYPAVNRELYADIRAAGAIVSEYPPGAETAGRHFPVRNRLISGLSLGVMVTEAPLRSGALITARLALEQGRDVFAVPGSIDASASAGCNQLIKEGAALVTSAGDVLAEYAALYPHKIAQNAGLEPMPPEYAEKAAERAARSKTPAGEREKAGGSQRAEFMRDAFVDLTQKTECMTPVRRAIIFCVAGEVRHVDQIAKLTGTAMTVLLPELTLMEVEGLIRRLPGNRFEINPEVMG